MIYNRFPKHFNLIFIRCTISSRTICIWDKNIFLLFQIQEMRNRLGTGATYSLFWIPVTSSFIPTIFNFDFCKQFKIIMFEWNGQSFNIKFVTNSIKQWIVLFRRGMLQIDHLNVSIFLLSVELSVRVYFGAILLRLNRNDAIRGLYKLRRPKINIL